VIITVTPNPSIDQIYWVERLNQRTTALLTRADRTQASAGGKGVNVSVLLNRLGVETSAMGFIAGYKGHTLEDLLHAQKITTNFVWTDGESRTNAIIVEQGQETQPIEVNALGPVISKNALSRFMKRYANALRRSDCLMCGGSLPPGLEDDFYGQLLQAAHEKKIKTILYTSDVPFDRACQQGPWMVKPDMRERTEVLGKVVQTREEAHRAGCDLLKTGSQIVIMAHELTRPVASQLVITNEGTWDFGARSATLKNRVGAGDAFVAGMFYKLQRGRSVAEAGRFGMAASIATSESSTIVASRSDIERAMKRVVEERL